MRGEPIGSPLMLVQEENNRSEDRVRPDNNCETNKGTRHHPLPSLKRGVISCGEDHESSTENEDRNTDCRSRDEECIDDIAQNLHVRHTGNARPADSHKKLGISLRVGK